jgi:hypothetical protein
MDLELVVAEGRKELLDRGTFANRHFIVGLPIGSLERHGDNPLRSVRI